MKMPTWAPSRPSDEHPSARSVRQVQATEIGLRPAGCCAQQCVDIPFVGRVCHCILDLPICP